MDANTILTGEPVSLKQVVLGEWIGGGDYDGVIAAYGSTQLTLNVTTVSAQRYGDGGKRLASYARITGGTINFTFAGDLSSIALMLGIDPDTTGVTPDRIRRVPLYNKGLPYFGLAGAADLEDGSPTGVHIFAPKCQVISDTVQLMSVGGGDTAEFGTVTFDITVLPDDNYQDGYANEVQHVAVGTPTAGVFTLTLGSQTTGNLVFNATPAEVKTALELLSIVGTDGVTVATGTPNGYDITFTGRLASTKLPLLTATAGALWNGTLAVTQTTDGSEGYELICAVYEVEAGYAPNLPPVFAVV